MLKKQSAILRKPSKKMMRATPNTKKLPDHHFKLLKVKRGLDGLGLFAGEDIKKGELIIEYIGNILNKEEAEKVTTNMYLFEITRNRTIDGSVRWNTARYANHACEPEANAESDVKKGRVFIKAIKAIKKEEEILYDYGEEFVNEYIAEKGCRCRAVVHSYKANKEASKEKDMGKNGGKKEKDSEKKATRKK